VTVDDRKHNVTVKCMECATTYTTADHEFEGGTCLCPVCSSSKAMKL